MRFLVLVVGMMLVGCSGDSAPTVPANATSAPPEVGSSIGGSGDAAGGGQGQQLRPR
ncbi:hypothetical protein SH449x_000674 [Pirellulaceae bacterium SH449]